MYMDIAAVTEITGQQYQDPADFKCVEKSPVGFAVLSPYNMNYPSVDMRHIFCGQIVHHEAQGFHSLNPSTDWTKCAFADKCNFFPDQNGYCRNVLIRTHNSSFEFKISGSSMWPSKLTPVQLVPLFQYLYSSCQPATTNADLCFPRCYWLGFNNDEFDIVIIARGHTIVTAYPAQKGTCSSSQRNNMKKCSSQPCQGMPL